MSIFYAASPQVQRVQKVQTVQRVVGKVLKIDRPAGRRVLKFDGPTGRGLWYRPAGDEFYNSASQNGKPNNRASPDGNAPLLPTAPLHGKASHVIFRSLSLPYKSRSLATPLCGGTTTRAMLRVTYENTASRSFILPPLAGEVPRSGQGGMLFPRPKGGCMVFSFPTGEARL